MKKLYVTLAMAALAMPTLFAQDLYVMGTMNSWTPEESWKMTQGSGNTYSVSGTVEANTDTDNVSFKIATSDWSTYNIGSKNDNGGFAVYSDKAGVVEVENGENPGNLWCSNWNGGTMTITLDMDAMTVTVTGGDSQPAAPGGPNGQVIYLVGSPNGWGINDSSMPLNVTSTAGVFQGSYNFAAGDVTFRFYQALGDWDAYSVGSQENDNPIAITNDFINYKNYTGSCVNGKGSWQIANWPGGVVDMTVNLNDMTVSFTTNVQIAVSAPEALYVRGSFNDWLNDTQKYPLKDYALTASTENKYVYAGSFELAALAANADPYEFKIADMNWGLYNYGALEGPNQDVVVTPEAPYIVDLEYGGANFVLSSWEGGNIYLSVTISSDWLTLEELTVSMEEGTVSVSRNLAEAAGLRYDNGVVSANTTTNFSVYNMAGQLVARSNGNSIDLNALAAGVYMVKAEGFKTVKIVK